MYLLREIDIDTGQLICEIYRNYNVIEKDNLIKLCQKSKYNVLIMDMTKPVGYSRFEIVYSKWST